LSRQNKDTKAAPGEENEKNYEETVKQELEQLTTFKVEESEEEKRRQRLLRRQAIMAKYQSPPQTATPEDTTTSNNIPSPIASTGMPGTSHSKEEVSSEESSPQASPVSLASEEVSSSKADEVTKPMHEHKDVEHAFDMFSDSYEVDSSSALTSATFEDVELKTDREGYYCPRLGEVLGKKYRVISVYGRGVFSTVVKATDLKTEETVAIKVTRMNDMMKNQAKKEVEILAKLTAQADATGTNNCCIRLIDSFEDRGMLCLVFEPMAFTLRQLTKKFGKDEGLALSAVRYYLRCMLIALYNLKKEGILHADIKPDNILVSESATVCKLADFGCAFPVTENDLTPYLASRWYRSPEVILGLPYDFATDMFGLGCLLYEIATGRVLFQGSSNNEMVKMFQEAKGRFPKKMLSRGLFASKHFDSNIRFLHRVTDEATKQNYVRELIFTNPTRNLKAEILEAYKDEPDQAQVLQLHDLLEQMIVLDPKKRITCEEAIRHPFLQPLQTQPQ
jgi:serine/threonine-protein kinase PRP4